MKKEKRFIEIFKQGGMLEEMRILVDRETGVNYLFIVNGYAGGLSPLLDADGKPVISSTYDLEQL